MVFGSGSSVGTVAVAGHHSKEASSRRIGHHTPHISGQFEKWQEEKEELEKKLSASLDFIKNHPLANGRKRKVAGLKKRISILDLRIKVKLRKVRKLEAKAA